MLKTILTLLLIVHCCASTADEWGSIGGQIIVEGKIPERVVLIAKDAAVSDNLPVGEHSCRIWHERFGHINKKYTVSVTASDRVELPAVSVSLDKLTSP